MTEFTQRCAATLYGIASDTAPGLGQTADALLHQKELWQAIMSPAAALAEREEILRSASSLDGQEELRAFLIMLAQEEKLETFPAIMEEFHQLELAAQGGDLCVMTCARQPDPSMLDDVRKAVCKLRGLKQVVLQIRIDPSLLGGFILEVQGVTYDRSIKGRLSQLARGLQEGESDDLNGLVDSLKEKIEGFHQETGVQETGTIMEIGDGIATIYGLRNAVYGELVEFETGVRGMVMNLERDSVSCVLLGSEKGLGEGSSVKRTGRPADVPVGEAMIGRVVNALCDPIDGKGAIKTAETRPIEHEASGVISREPVTVPLQTGILAIDSMVPIGRGQRELVIGDRQTGKTAIAVDTILNQKNQKVICIYVAIGQKASSIARVQHTLERGGAMEYSIIVAATASDSAPLQYIAPYAGASIGEYFMEKGRDVLIVYDDLSKHAVAYRTLSLLLKRSPGREAYPGDVFYLHSRLLERACRLTAEYGGGSKTALPIVETQAGDVSAYIPTNVISITDGQIYLETDLFFSGQRPAVNVGLSVSRVGGAAQTRAIKKTAGTLRIDLARFRELEVFNQFAADLDAATQKTLGHGKRMMEILRQPLYHPMSVARQATILYIATNGLIDDIPLEKTAEFVRSFADEMEVTQVETLKEIQASGVLSPASVERIRAALEDYKKRTGIESIKDKEERQ